MMSEMDCQELTRGYQNDGIPSKSARTQYLAALAAGLGAFSVGTALAWSSSALPQLQNSTTTTLDVPVTQDESMWIGSLLPIGALLGAFPAGHLADRIGRKYLQMGLAVPFIVSWIVIVLARQLVALYVARLLAGITAGGICVVAPMYIGEIADNTIRGSLGSYFQLLLTIGILFSYLLGAFLDLLWLTIICGIVPAVFFIVFYFMPETPYYLVARNKIDLAEKSLAWLRGGNHRRVKDELARIEAEVDEAKRNKGTFRDLISSKANLNSLLISLGLMFFQQLCGINAVIFYAAQIFEIAGSDLDPKISAIVIGVSQVVFTYISTLLVDRAGRKILLLISSGVMIICLIVLGVYFHLKQDEEAVKSIGWLPLLSLTVFIFCFSIGFGPLPWMMMGELFSSSVKEMACAMAVTLNWLLAFVVTKTFSDLTEALGTSGAFWLFGGISCLGFLFICFVVKETKGKTFAEIQKMIGG